MMKKKIPMPRLPRPQRLRLVFSFLVFLISLAATLLVTAALEILLAFGVFPNTPSFLVLAYVLAPSVVFATLFGRLFGKRFFHSIDNIKDAMVKVSEGDFTVTLPERFRVAELHDMAHCFNLMVKQLGSMEVMHKDFIRNVSHEFKTPLSAISGYATLLQSEELSEEKRIAYAEKIAVSTARLASMTGNVLMLSQLENQEMKAKKVHFSLDEQLRKVLLLFEKQWSDKEIEISMDEGSALGYGYEELLFQVWQNLVSNAIKFTERGGKISLSLQQEEDRVLVSVEDNGIGIDPEDKARIFDKFYQADASRAVGGNGLGLALVKKIVDMHGGKIEVDSTLGKGTVFTVHLPTEDAVLK